MTTENTTVETQDIHAGDDDFLAELEAELNADSMESPDVEEVGADDVIAADADTDEPEPQEAASEKPKAKAKAKSKGKPAKNASEKTDAKDTEGDAETSEAKPKRPSVSGLAPSEALRTAMGDKMYEYCVADQAQAKLTGDKRKAAIDQYLADEVDVLAKKVKEKAVNAFMAISGQATLSVYTQVALKMLKDKKEVSGVDIKNKYLNRPYSPGTSSAQSSQMMQLLPALKIAKRQGNVLVLIEDSPLFELLTAE